MPDPKKREPSEIEFEEPDEDAWDEVVVDEWEDVDEVGDENDDPREDEQP